MKLIRISVFKVDIMWYEYLVKMFERQKGRDLTQSYNNSPYTHRKSKKERDNTKTTPKTSISQRLRTD